MQENEKKRKQIIAIVSCVLCCAVVVGIAVAKTINADRPGGVTPDVTLDTTAAEINRDDVGGIITGSPDVRATVPQTDNATVPHSSAGGVQVIPGGNPTAEDETDSAAASITQSANVTLPAPERYSLPMSATIGKDFSMGQPVFSNTLGDWRAHNGVDFEGAVGDMVKSVADGFVKDVYDDPLWGTVVEIDHGGGVVAKYCGLGRGSTVEKNIEVKINDTVGYLGTVPVEAQDNAHMHFEMTVNGVISDPLEVMGYFEDR